MTAGQADGAFVRWISSEYSQLRVPSAHVNAQMALPLQTALATPLTPLDVSNAYASFSTFLSTYENRIGQGTRAVAVHLPALLPDFPDTSPLILDDACGTGAVTFEVLKQLPNAYVYATDASKDMIALMHAQMQVSIANYNLKDNIVSAVVMDAQALDFPPSTFDAAIMNFGVHFLPDPVLGVSQMHRVLKSDGAALVTVWSEIGFLPILWEVQRRVAPEIPVETLPVLERWFDDEFFTQQMREGGFENVSLRKLGVALSGEGLKGLCDVLVQNFSGLVGSSWNEQEKARLEEVTMEVLRDRGKALGVIDTGGQMLGVKMVASIAIGRK